MLAMWIIIGTRYACHVMTEGTSFACHISFVSDQVCLPYFPNLISISCKIWSFPVESDWTIKFAFLLSIISVNQIWPEVNVFDKEWMLNLKNMASIPGPLYYWHGKHMWSLLLLTWQAYLVRNKTVMASTLSPFYHQYGKYTWSLSFDLRVFIRDYSNRDTGPGFFQFHDSLFQRRYPLFLDNCSSSILYTLYSMDTFQRSDLAPPPTR